MKNLDKALRNFIYRVGAETVNVAKEHTAPIKTGNLKRDINVIRVDARSVTIGNTAGVRYAKFVHGGTGLYGAKKRKITPKKARALKTPYGYRKSIKGQKPNPYLLKAWEGYKIRGLRRATAALAKDIREDLVKDIKTDLMKTLK